MPAQACWQTSAMMLKTITGTLYKYEEQKHLLLNEEQKHLLLTEIY